MIDKTLADLCLKSYLPAAREVEVGTDLSASVYDLPEGGTVVAFRGTANLAGWMRDLNVLPKSHPQLGYCHRGFLEGGTLLWQHIDPSDDGPIIFTGHSLGGAVAIIAAALRIANRQRVDEVVTFGSPRAGFATLAALFGSVKVRQYVRGHDPVTRVPLELITFPYRHIVELTQVGKPDRTPWNDHDIMGYREDV